MGGQWVLVTSTRECEPQDGRLFLSEVSLRVAAGLRGPHCPSSKGAEVPAAQSGEEGLATHSVERGKATSVWLAVLLRDIRGVSERSRVADTHQMGSETFVKYMEPGRGVQPGHPCFLPLPPGLQCLSRKPQNLDLFQEAGVPAK